MSQEEIVSAYMRGGMSRRMLIRRLAAGGMGLAAAVAYAHVHVGFEVMLYILHGRVRHEFGDQLRQSVENQAGDFIYIEPGIPHEVFNLSDTEPVVAVVARSDADEWAHIVAYDRETGKTGDVVPST